MAILVVGMAAEEEEKWEMSFTEKDEEEDKWIMHYSSKHQILLVGERDFLFSFAYRRNLALLLTSGLLLLILMVIHSFL